MKGNINNEIDLEIVDVAQMPSVPTEISAAPAESNDLTMQTKAVATSVIVQDTSERARRSQKLESALQLIALGTSVITLAIIAYLIYLVRDILSLLVISFLIAYVLSPVVNIFERSGVNRTLVVTGLSIVIVGILILTALVITDRITSQLATFKTDLPEMTETLKVKIAEWESKLKEAIPQLESLKLSEKLTIENLQNWVSSRIENTMSVISGISSQIMPIISMLVIVPFMTFFMLCGGERAKKRFIEIVPNRYFETTLVLISELDRQLGQYLRSRVLETIILSAIGIIGFAVLKVRFYIFLGILAGVANIIPYFGPVLGAIPACIIALVYPPFGEWSVPLVIALTFLLQFIDNAIIVPIVVGKSVDLGPVTIIIVVLIGSQFFGLFGILVAVPVVAMIKVAVQVIYKEIKGYPEFG
ncbi:TPA: AI-2E family transporter [Candidatus Poribacteria bacterium]|nr:AI-2E family transporter [Candidatus Poribacteria bacterium]